ncbi:SufD family Fe-S cluster assembly protein [Ramlibacter sp.]|uniref:SufD family Fe-S cluster assembly protein n=1 Tax=Ramlibacter sp. TaxID=1917967 RepID=UPI002BD8A7CE|nr:SufD family Fe-S cluster assembly protein [Ramlibacter sp.]HWI83105.1 SufD family Fe-S cluster assembly protein [Ramlibacter sp.]
MNVARADALAARSHLAAEGWIPRTAESFRHLPPPDAALWLGEPAAPAPAAADGGWRLHDLPAAQRALVDARWLDAADAAQRGQLLAGLPPPGRDEAAPFAWAHRALLRHGLRLRIAAGAPLVLRLDRRATAAVEAPLLVIELLPGARCVLLESHENGGQDVQNLQVHVRVGEGAALQHLRAVMPEAAAHLAHDVQVQLAADAAYEQCLLASGSRYHLQRTVLDLLGPRALAHTAGVLLGADTALDQQTQVRHGAAHTRSGIDALALGSGGARLVANARSTISPGCDEAQTRQRLAGVPTAGQPRLVLRPHLEIHHDDVQAAHGATWGALPQEALFHARQRGLDETAAKAMILHGMAQAVFARALADPDTLERAGFETLLARALARHLAPAGMQERRHG